MPIPGRIQPPHPSLPLHAASAGSAPAAPTTPPDPAAVADRAIADVHALQRTSSTGSRGRAAQLEAAVRRVVRLHTSQPSDQAGLVRLLQNRDVGRALAGASRDQIAAEIDRQLAAAGDGGVLDTMNHGVEAVLHTNRNEVLDAIRSGFDATIHGDIATRGRNLLNERRQALSALETAALNNLPRLQNAAPGTQEAALARRLGVLDDPGDAARVRATFAEAHQGLNELQDWLGGQTWQNGDFDGTAMRAAARRGWQMTSADGFIEPSVVGHRSVDGAIHIGLSEVEGAELIVDAHGTMEAFEVGGLMASAGEALAFGVGAAGLGLGLYIHHLAEERQAERIDAAHELGL